jgi:sulfate permease, SulP family
MTHSATVLLITLFFGRWAALIPMATLAGVLLVVAYQMSEWRVFRAELTSPKSDVAVLLVTFFLTVFVDLTVAIAVGMVVAAFLFMNRMAEVTDVQAMSGDLIEEEDADDPTASTAYVIPRGVEVFGINGPFFFGAAETFKDTIATVAGKPKVLIIRLRRTPAMDATGLHALTDVVRRSRGDGTLVLLSELQPQPLATLRRSVLVDVIGEENICATMEEAVARAHEELEVRRVLGRGSGHRGAVA